MHRISARAISQQRDGRRAQEEKRTGMRSKAVRVATRLNTTKGGSKGGSKGSSKDDGKESGGTKGKTGQIGKAAETHIGWDGRRR